MRRNFTLRRTQSRNIISLENKPNVKLVTTEDGAGLVLGGENGHVQALSRGGNSFVKIVMGDGRDNAIKP